MIMSPPWRQTLLHSAVVVLIGILAGVVHVFIENDLRLPDPILRILPKLGLYPSVLRAIDEAYLVLFTFGGLIATIVFLFRARFIEAVTYLALTASVFLATQVSVDLKGGRFSFPGQSHDMIAEIYRHRRPLPGGSIEFPGLIALGDECHPPIGCSCWIASGLSHDSGIDKEVDRHWHPPRSAVVPRVTTPAYFTIVHVKRIDPNAYSVIGCEYGFL
jgi:hypothetical protein